LITETIFYGIDSYKTLVQQNQKNFNISRLFRGFIPVVGLGTLPQFAVFFGVYEPVKQNLEAVGSPHLSGATAASIAAVIAGVPSCLVGVPTDVVKKRMLQNNETLRHILADGPAALMRGWQVNLLKDLPFCAIKMGLFEGCKTLYVKAIRPSMATAQEGRKLIKHSEQVSAAESAAIGCASGALTAFVTCPLDVANTVVKSSLEGRSVADTVKFIVRERGVRGLFVGLAPRMLILGMGSTVFWYFYGVIKLAI
jgi:hypothetical protein